MVSEEIAELRTMYFFTPLDGQSWGLTYEGLETKLRERNPEEFVRIDDGSEGPVRGSSMHFGITLDDEVLEGMALLSPEGVCVLDCDAHSAASFGLWLRNDVVPASSTIMFNTEWGVEADLPPASVPDATRPRIVAAFVTHVEETGALD